MGLKNGWLRDKSNGEMVLYVAGTEALRLGATTMGLFGTTPAGQASHITDSTDTSATDQKAPVNAALVVLEEAGLVAAS